MRRTTTITLAAGAATLAAAAALQAHTATTAVACTDGRAQATFSYAAFGPGTFTSREVITLDGQVVYDEARPVAGPGGAFTVALAQAVYGDRTMTATATAQQDGRVYRSTVTQGVRCGLAPKQPPTPGPSPTPVPPQAEPVPAPVAPSTPVATPTKPNPPAAPVRPAWRLAKRGPAVMREGVGAYWTLTVTNASRRRIVGAVLVDQLPAGLAVARRVGSGAVVESGYVRWQLPTLRPGQVLTRTLALVVPAGSGLRRVCNVATVANPGTPVHTATLLRAERCSRVQQLPPRRRTVAVTG